MVTDGFAATAQGELAPPDRLAAGAKIGDYVIDRFLGAGAMGEVYAGHHPVIGKKVAIKLLKADLASSAEATERFVREARAANVIDHPNVIDIFNFGTTETGRLFLVMELVAGMSLRARIANGPLEVDQALAILGTIAEALDAAHARGVVHRDLKPDNVMLSAETPPKVFVLDFGIARLVSAADAAKGLTGNGTLTGQGTWLGTPGYMAPEQWSSDGAGPASDRYALGVMAFELLAGKLPFSAPNLPAMMEQHFRAPVPALGTRRGPIKTLTGDAIATETLDPVLARAMAKDPDARFPTGGAMVDALRLATGTGTGPVIGKLGKLERPTVPVTRRPWLPIAAGVGVLGAAIAAGIMIRSKPAEDPETVPVVAPAGSVALRITTAPPGAVLVENDRVIGPTPQDLYPHPGERISLTAKKPGYEPIATQLVAPPTTASEVQRHVRLQLVQSNGFEGVWRLSNGELREFRRAGERVDIYKRDAVTGPSELYRTYDIVAPTDGAPGFAFTGHETIVAAGDLRCTFQSTVAYHYDPATDALDVAREHVGTKVEDGHCVVVSRELAAGQLLARVDGAGDVHYHDAPVGRPPIAKPSPTMDNTLDDKLDQRLKPGDDKSIQQKNAPLPAPPIKQAPVKKAVKPSPSKKSAAIDFGNGAKGNAPNAQIQQQMPPPQVPPANPDTEPAAQQQQPQQLQKK